MRSRRTILRASAVLAIGALVFCSTADAQLLGNGGLMIGVGGVLCGQVQSIAGPTSAAEVISEPTGPSYYAKKHVGAIKDAEFLVQAGFGLNWQLYAWIQQSWNWAHEGKELKLIKDDQIFIVPNSMIQETTIPALDKRLKTDAWIALKLTAPKMGVKSGGNMVKAPAGVAIKPWLASGFSFEMDGHKLDSVIRIEPFTVRQSKVTDDVGDARDFLQVPDKLEFPNVVITVPASDSKIWTDWYQQFVINGDNGDLKEKNATIRLIGTDGKELANIGLANVGIYKTVPSKSADGTAVLVVHFYAERMTFNPQK